MSDYVHYTQPRNWDTTPVNTWGDGCYGSGGGDGSGVGSHDDYQGGDLSGNGLSGLPPEDLP